MVDFEARSLTALLRGRLLGADLQARNPGLKPWAMLFRRFAAPDEQEFLRVRGVNKDAF